MADQEATDARSVCYARMRDVMKEGITRYYEQFPERWDARAEEALECSTQGLERIFTILDEFDIRFREQQPPSFWRKYFSG